MLAGEFHDRAQTALLLPAEVLHDMLQHFDIYRRPERFEQFIAACEMDATAQPGQQSHDYVQAHYLRGAAEAARAVQAKPLIDQGYKGAELGEALKRERLLAVRKYQLEQQISAGLP